MSLRRRLPCVTLTLVVLACQLGCDSGRINTNYNTSTNTSSTSPDPFLGDRIQLRIAERGYAEVKVINDRGVIFLFGYVDYDFQKADAEQMAKETPGVTAVHNQIVVCTRRPVNVNKPGGPRRC